MNLFPAAFLPKRRALAIFAALPLLVPSLAPAQGPLAPIGPPTQTMRSLDQIEPRTPIPSATVGLTPPYTISQAGSYYLTGNVDVTGGTAIVITADNVALDLNGFTISSSSGSAVGDAINIDGRKNLAISNGGIRGGSTAGTGFAGGINWNSIQPSNVRVSSVTVAGVSSYPIDLGGDGSSVVQGCSVSGSANFGIQAGTVSNSTALRCGSTPIVATTISNSVGSLASNGTLTVFDTSASASSISSIQTGVTTANTNISSANTGISTANTNINTANTSINTANTSINAANTGITSLLAAADRRIPIPGAAVGMTPPYAISQPGSYYLTGNVSVPSGTAITINVNNVVLDLGGFLILSSASTASGFGVNLTGTRQNVVVGNGLISGGFSNGVSASNASVNIVVEKLAVQGVGGLGIALGPSSTTVRACAISGTGGNGITGGLVTDCTVDAAAGNYGIFASTVARCRAASTSTAASSFAIYADNASDCVGTSAAGGGVAVLSAAINCTGASQGSGTGVTGEVLTNCHGTSGSGSGLSASLNALN